MACCWYLHTKSVGWTYTGRHWKRRESNLAAGTQVNPKRKGYGPKYYQCWGKTKYFGTSESPWDTVTVPVKKFGVNNWRICGDYKRTNTAPEYDRYPKPAINNISQSLKGFIYAPSIWAKVSTTHNQKKDDRHISLDHTLRYIPVCKSPMRGALYSRRFSAAYADFIRSTYSWKGCQVYMDFISISGSTIEHHLGNLRLILQ